MVEMTCSLEPPTCNIRLSWLSYFSRSHPILIWTKKSSLPPNPLSRFPSSFHEFNLILFLTLRYIILDIYQTPTLSSAENSDDQEDGNICFFPLKAEYKHLDL